MDAKVLDFKRQTPTRPPIKTRHKETGKLLLLKKPAGEKEEEPAALADERHIIIAFIEDALRDPKEPLISEEENQRLRKAVASLIAMFPVVNRKIFDDTRDEYREKPKPPPGTIANKERRYWEAAKSINFSPIPMFDMEQARACFIPPLEKRPKRVLFFKPELRREVEEYPIPYRLRYGEMFFFIILRMFRRQYQYAKIRARIAELKTSWNFVELDEKTAFKMSGWSFLKSFF